MNLLFELGYSCLKRSNLLSVLPLFLLIFLQLLVYENSPNIIRLAVVAVIFLVGPKFEFQCQMCLYLLLLLQLCVIIFLLQRIDSLLVIHLYLGRLFPLLFDGIFQKTYLPFKSQLLLLQHRFMVRKISMYLAYLFCQLFIFGKELNIKLKLFVEVLSKLQFFFLLMLRSHHYYIIIIFDLIETF